MKQVHLQPEMLRLELLLSTTDTSHPAISPEQVRTLVVPDASNPRRRLYDAPVPEPITDRNHKRIGSRVALKNVADPSFSVRAMCRRTKNAFLSKKYEGLLSANLGNDALVLASYADVLRDKIAGSFQLKLEVSLPDTLHMVDSFGETLQAAASSEAANNVNIRPLNVGARPRALYAVNHSLMSGIVGQQQFLNRIFDPSSVDYAMTELYGLPPVAARSLYFSAFEGNSDAFNAAQVVKQSLPSAKVA